VSRLDRVLRFRFALQPWRFDSEYARAWCELGFPLCGIDHADELDDGFVMFVGADTASTFSRSA
jgi:hypothetical protein